MNVPARETVRTNVSVGSIPDNRYAVFAEHIFDTYMKSATVFETNIRIWNLHQKSGENATAWGARCLRAIIYRVKKDVADCSRHQDFTKKQEIVLDKDKIELEYAYTKFLSQAYLESTMLYLRARIDLSPWHTLFIDGMGTKEEKGELTDKCFVPLSEG